MLIESKDYANWYLIITSLFLDCSVLWSDIPFIRTANMYRVIMLFACTCVKFITYIMFILIF